jgi:probable phosphoglycerate mutase
MESERAATLLLVRHAETECNVASRLSGWTDSRLSRRGEAQVELLAAHFNRAHAHATAIYASPLIRARRTAEAIAALTGHSPTFDADLREMHFGELDGQPLEAVRNGYADLLRLDENPEGDFAWPGGESRNAFTTRVRTTIDRIARAHPGQAVAVVTHGGVISTFLTIVHRQPPGLWREWLVNNASLTEVAWDPVEGVGALLRRGDDAHLAELLAEEASAGD